MGGVIAWQWACPHCQSVCRKAPHILMPRYTQYYRWHVLLIRRTPKTPIPKSYHFSLIQLKLVNDKRKTSE